VIKDVAGRQRAALSPRVIFFDPRWPPKSVEARFSRHVAPVKDQKFSLRATGFARAGH